MRKSVDLEKWEKLAPGSRRRSDLCQSALVKSAGERAADARGKSRRQALSVLQHKTLVGRIAEKLFHGGVNSNVLAFRQLAPASLLPLREKVDRRAAPRRMRGVPA
ncbi:hypothetical protein, partial [Mesorhizobium sp.]|uniref:hypothetical protein n=1 Tax=Mesorhizobium sp. TaxID=1871066 RepID=UPI0025C1C8E8